MDESGRRGRINTGKKMKSSSRKYYDCWWPAREVLLSEICWLWNVGMFDLSVYWLANSNLNGFELDLIFLLTITFIWNSYDGDCLVPFPLDKRSPRNGYVTLCPLLWMEFMCALGKTLFYIIFITGNVDLPNINVLYTLHVSFTQTNSFVSGETKALVITIPF